MKLSTGGLAYLEQDIQLHHFYRHGQSSLRKNCLLTSAHTPCKHPVYICVSYFEGFSFTAVQYTLALGHLVLGGSLRKLVALLLFCLDPSKMWTSTSRAGKAPSFKLSHISLFYDSFFLLKQQHLDIDCNNSSTLVSETCWCNFDLLQLRAIAG